MISHEYKCIFVHQRKCAGTSIMTSFGMDANHPDWHYMNEGILSAEIHQAPAYFRFSVVRNPWDRFVSGWKYCESVRDKSLREVLEDLPTMGYDYRHLSRCQRDILFGSDGWLVVDYVMRFETLQNDFDMVCDHIGKPWVKLPLLNRRPDRRPYQEYFQDQHERTLFLEHFGRDARTFGYHF